MNIYKLNLFREITPKGETLANEMIILYLMYFFNIKEKKSKVW